MWLVMAVFFIGIMIYSLKSPYVGLLGMMASDVLRPGELYDQIAFLHIERTLAILVLMSFIMRVKKIEWPTVTKTLFFFWFTMFLSVPLSIWPSDSLSNVIAFGRLMIYHILIVNLVQTEKRFKGFLLVYTLLIGWVAASSLIAFSQGIIYHGTEAVERAEALNSFGGNPNSLGTTMVVSLPLVMLLLTKKSGIARLISLAVIVLNVATVIFTGSRTAFVALIFLIMVAPLLRKKGLLYVPVAVLLVAMVWVATPQAYKERYLSVEQRDKDVSYELRLTTWSAGWRMFKDRPITGIGMGEFGVANGTKYWPDRARPRWYNAHSLYLQTISELGIIGAIGFLIFLIQFFKLNGRQQRRLEPHKEIPAYIRLFPYACNMTLIGLLFEGYAGHDLYRSAWYMMAALSAALAYIPVKDSELDANTPPEVIKVESTPPQFSYAGMGMNNSRRPR
ncbi:MAG: O-antigen ligase family protein [Candidatus Acidiferrales bacterium]